MRVVQRLLTLGASVHPFDRSGNTALHYAAAGGYTDILECLISGGADVDATNFYGETAMSRAAINKNSFRATSAKILEAGADPVDARLLQQLLGKAEKIGYNSMAARRRWASQQASIHK